MAKKDITLPTEDWRLVLRTFADGPEPRDKLQAAREYRLVELLAHRIQSAEGPSLAIQLTRAQRNPLIAAMLNPTIPFKRLAKPRTWGIMEALGWTPPEIEDDDPEEDES